MKSHNKALHLTAIPLRLIAVGELYHYTVKTINKTATIKIGIHGTIFMKQGR